jgi:hypothetical protein
MGLRLAWRGEGLITEMGERARPDRDRRRDPRPGGGPFNVMGTGAGPREDYPRTRPPAETGTAPVRR